MSDLASYLAEHRPQTVNKTLSKRLRKAKWWLSNWILTRGLWVSRTRDKSNLWFFIEFLAIPVRFSANQANYIGIITIKFHINLMFLLKFILILLATISFFFFFPSNPNRVSNIFQTFLSSDWFITKIYSDVDLKYLI